MKLGKKKYLIIGIVVIVLIGVLVWYKNKTSNTATTPQTTMVAYGTLVTSVSGSGSLAPQTIASVTAPSYGIVDKIFVKSGDNVSAGQALFHFKSLASAADIAKARATYLSAKASLINAKLTAQDAAANEQILSKNLSASQLAYQAAQVDAKKSVKDAQKTIVDAMDATVNNNLDILSAQTGEAIAKLGLTSAQLKARQNVITAQSSLSSAQRDAASASLKVESAQTSLASAQVNLTSASLSFQELSNQTITAPIDGQVVNMALKVGSVIGASQSSGSTSSASTTSTNSDTTVLSIFNPNSLSITVAISEVDIPNIKVDAPATITFDSLPNKTFAGHVINMDTIGTTSSGVTTYNTEVALNDTDPTMRPGMSASASIITNRKDRVLLVPNGAIRNSSNNQATVTVVKNSTEITTDVTTGLSNDLETEITNGLHEGDLVTTGTTTGNSTQNSGATSLFGGNNRGGGIRPF